MKKIESLLALFLIALCFHASAQVTKLNNSYISGTPFLGWDASLPYQLDIVNDNARPINFYTNAGGTFANLRMLIDANGNIGMGGNGFT